MTLSIVPGSRGSARPVPPAPPRPARRRGLPRAPSWALVAGAAAQVAVRLWLARARTAPVADPDETGYLMAARWLAGGPGADLSGNTFYQGGYPLLLAPVHWFSADPVTVYTAVLVLNAVAGAALFPLGYAAARRLGLGSRAALPLAFAAALLPATTFFGAFALADAVLPAVVLAWLLVLDRFVRNGRGLDAASASFIASYAAAVHTRGTVLLAVHVLALAAMSRRRLPAVVAGGAVAIGGYFAGAALNAHIQGGLYPDGSRDLAANLGVRLTTAPGQEWALAGAAGQIWYLVVSTWGLAGIGLVVAAAAVLGRRTPAADRTMAAVLLTVTCGIAYASSAALPDEHRVGNFAYGRYLACLALGYALVGAAALVRSRARAAARLTAAALIVPAGAGLWVTGYAGERLRTHAFIAFDFPETAFLTGDRTALHLPEATFAAGVLLCGLLTLSRLGRRAPMAMAVALAGTNLAALTFAMGPSPERVRPAPPFPGPAAGGVAADVSLPWTVRTAHMHHVWWTGIRRIDIRDGRPPAPGVCTVVAPLPDGAAPASSWPAHPAGWRPHTGRTGPTGWVSWHAPACGAASR